jgi:hypothetical protein
MMENDTPPNQDGKLALKHPEKWSIRASNFVNVASLGSLKDIEKVRGTVLFSMAHG